MNVTIEIGEWVDRTRLTGEEKRSEERWGVHAIAQCSWPDGTKAKFESPGRLGVRPGRRAAVADTEADKLRRMLASLGIATPAKNAESLGETTTPSAEKHDAERATLLKGTLPNTEEVFNLIDALASTDGIWWSYSPRRGLRGSVTGTAPRLGQAFQDASGMRREARWIDDGSYGCLCPLALAAEADTELTEADLEEIHLSAHETARARAAANGHDTAEEIEEHFNSGNAAWGLLVPVSDECPLEEWAAEHLDEPTRTDMERVTRTYKALSSYARSRLRPRRPRVMDYDDPAGAR